MICDNCPALCCEGYEYPEEYCALGFDEEYGKDDGCTVNHNRIKAEMRKLNEEYALQYQDCGEWFKESEYNKKHNTDVSDINGKYVKQAMHCIGLDYKKPYTRHGKKFYKPYRNGYDAGGKDIEIWDALTHIGYAYKNRVYHLTAAGFRWLGRILNITIKAGEQE